MLTNSESYRLAYGGFSPPLDRCRNIDTKQKCEDGELVENSERHENDGIVHFRMR